MRWNLEVAKNQKNYSRKRSHVDEEYTKFPFENFQVYKIFLCCIDPKDYPKHDNGNMRDLLCWFRSWANNMDSTNTLLDGGGDNFSGIEQLTESMNIEFIEEGQQKQPRNHGNKKLIYYDVECLDDGQNILVKKKDLNLNLEELLNIDIEEEYYQHYVDSFLDAKAQINYIASAIGSNDKYRENLRRYGENHNDEFAKTLRKVFLDVQEEEKRKHIVESLNIFLKDYVESIFRICVNVYTIW